MISAFRQIDAIHSSCSGLICYLEQMLVVYVCSFTGRTLESFTASFIALFSLVLIEVEPAMTLPPPHIDDLLLFAFYFLS